MKNKLVKYRQLDDEFVKFLLTDLFYTSYFRIAICKL
jgi:hypothetical protein